MQAESRDCFVAPFADHSVGLVDVLSFSVVTFRQFFGEPASSAALLACVYLAELDTLAGLVEHNGRVSLHWRASPAGKHQAQSLQGLLAVENEEFFPGCLCRTFQEPLLVAGGSDKRDPRMGSPVLVGFKLEAAGPRYVDHLCIRSTQGKREMTVSALQRMPDRNVFLAGVFQAVYVVDWSGIGLSLLNYFSGVHSCSLRSTDLVCQICCSLDAFYSICPADKFLVYGKPF